MRARMLVTGLAFSGLMRLGRLWVLRTFGLAGTR
jgi:hypothetical protein